MAGFVKTAENILYTLAAILAIPGLIYLKYLQAKWHNDQKDEKADVQTLFSGKK